MTQDSSVSTYFTKRNLALSAISLGIGIGCYQFSSDSSPNTPSDPSADQAHKIVKSPEAINNTLTANDSAEQISQATPVHKHGSDCGCSVHSGAKLVTAKAAVAPSIPVTETLKKQLLNHAKGQEISFTLPGGRLASGVVEVTKTSRGRTITLSGSLTAPEEGNFYFHEESAPGLEGKLSGAVYFTNSDTAYSIATTEDGSQKLKETHADNILCRNYSTFPLAQGADTIKQPQEIVAEHPTNIPIPGYQNGIIPLSSLPTSSAVAYLDFDGELGPFISWGDFDAAHSGANNTQVKEVWERVAEDFAPFNINITTDLEVYLNAPPHSRIHCIITPTTNAAPGAGGVAFGGDFNRTIDRPCWAFSTSGKFAAEVISHEIGHTLGLGHDGRTSPSEIYYAGHGSQYVSWAPIMGSSYIPYLSQWSQGEYTNANNQQDDLSIIASNNNVGYRVDDHGANLASASHLEINSDDSVDSEGIIETRADIDTFKFTITSSNSRVNLNVAPAANGPNLDIQAEISDSSGTVIYSNNPDTALNASFTNLSLSAGEYTLSVSGVGRGSATADGYTDYASLGEYKITGTVENSLEPDRFTLAENPLNGATIGTVTKNNNHGTDTLTYAIVSGDANSAFAIDSNGILTVADAAQFDFEALSGYFDDPATFDLSVTITNSTTPSLTESVRVVVTLTDVNEAPVITLASSLNVLEHTAVGTELLTATQVDNDPNDLVQRWSITAGNTGGAFAIDPSSGALTIAAPLTAAVPSYTLEITSTDAGTPVLSSSATISINVIDIVEGYLPGSITQSFYENISGTTLTNLTNSSRFPNDPDSLTQLTSISSNNHGDNYGSVIRGYLIPPTTGNYTFWVSGDDQADMRLSTDANPANAAVIATLTGAVGENNWTAQSNQESAPVTLTAGQPYYLEIRHKEGGGGDHISAAWQGPGISQTIIPGRFLAPYDFNYTPRITSATLSIQDDIYNSRKVISTLPVTDLNSADTHSGFTIVSGNDDGVFAIDPASGAITIADNSSIVAGNTYTLVVSVTDSDTPPLKGNGTITVNVMSATTLVIKQQIYTNINGNSVTDLTGNSNYPSSPNSTRPLTAFDSGLSNGDSYGSRIRAYVEPPTTGNYTFYISSDDQGQLFLSSDDTSGNKTQIASTNYAPYNDWTSDSNQKSSPVALVAGQKYYIEALHKEGAGGDHLQVAWEGPDFATPTVIAGIYLEQFNVDAAPSWDSAPYAFTTDNTNANGTVVGTVSATDTSSDTLVYNIISGNDSGGFAIHPTTGVITLADHFAIPLGANVLRVGVQDEAAIYNEIETNVTITVTGSNPPSVNAASFNVVENSGPATSIGTVTFTDPDAETWIFSIDSGNSAGFFAIDPSSGVISPTASADLNFESGISYQLNVRVTDSGGFSGVATISITVTDTDESALKGLKGWEEAVHAGSTFIHKRIEPLAGNTTTTVDLSALTGDATFEFIVEAEDNGQASLDLLRGNSRVLKFEQWNNLGTLGATQLGTADWTFTAETDQSIASPYGAAHHIVFVVDTTAGETRAYINGVHVGTLAQVLDLASATAILGDSNLRSDSAPGIHTFAAYNNALSQAEILAHATSLNSSPVANDTTITVSEAVTSGSAIGTVTATDPEAADTLAYAITAGNTDGAFAINSATGEITTAKAMNYEASSQYALTVTVSDDGVLVLSDTATVTITVSDADESASTGLLAWEDAVHNDTAHLQTHTTPLAGNSSTSVDLSSISGDATYEFVVETEDLGYGETRLLDGNGWSLRFKQNSPSASNLGFTEYGVLDYQLASETGQSVASPYGRTAHIVFVVDTTTPLTRVYVDGILVGTQAATPNLAHLTATLGSSGSTAIRNDSDPGIHAFAAYNSVLPHQEIISHYRAWFGASSTVDADGDDLDDSWELTHYGAIGAVATTTNSDGDGYNSFKEMAFGTDPTTISQLSDHMTSSIVDDGGTDKLELKFRRPINHASLGVVYQLKSSTDLSTWGDDTTPATATTPDADGITEWISYRFTPSDAAKKFIQLQATPAP